VFSNKVTMKVYCKVCNLPLTNFLKNYAGDSFGEASEQPFVQKGFYTVSNGDFFTGTEGCLIVNVEDMINTVNHTITGRLNGCCGLDGCDGPNKMCINGHEVATEKSDCWMPMAIIFEKEKTILK
jgi:hypothetical protein